MKSVACTVEEFYQVEKDLEKSREKERARYHRRKADPLWVEKNRERGRKASATHYAKHKSDPDWYASMLENGRKFRQNNPEYRRQYRARTKDRWEMTWVCERYKVSKIEAADLIARKKLGCENCGALGEPHIDHDHATGKVRGILCGGCNRALGCAKDNPATLRALADYLEAHS